MRLVVFSPVTIASAIGRVTGLIVAQLTAEGHEVLVVRTEDYSHLRSQPRELGVPILAWDEEFAIRDAVQRADAIVYQVGDNYQFHRGCVEWLPRLPGIVCLHDYFVGDLFLVWALAHKAEAQSVLRGWYGDAVASKYFAWSVSSTFIDRTAATAPMTEWIGAMARGVIVHSGWDVDRVLRSCAGPVQVLPLPYEAPATLPRTVASATPLGRFTVLTVGHVNRNKRAESVIRAIGGSSRLKDRATYMLIGRITIDETARLQDVASELGVDLLIRGEVDDGELEHAMASVDVVCCLRYPALESASASAIEAMLAGKAILVMDTGFYRDLPDDVAGKVSPERELADITRILEDLESDEGKRQALARRAADWARSTFRADNYATSLVQLARAVAAATPPIDAARYFAETLARWGGTDRTIAARELVEPLRIFNGGRGRRTTGSRHP